jgi:hypothetical protein
LFIASADLNTNNPTLKAKTSAFKLKASLFILDPEINNYIGVIL